MEQIASGPRRSQPASSDPELLDWIREAIVEGESWEEIGASLQAHDPDGEDVRLRQFVFAFTYRQRVSEKYGADPYIVTTVANLRSPLLDAGARQELRRAQVREWRERAGEGAGMLRVHSLETALELARRYGCNVEVKELRSELGAIGFEKLELKEIGAEVDLPPEEVEQVLASFQDAPNWQHALGMLAAQPPPLASHNRWRRGSTLCLVWMGLR